MPETIEKYPTLHMKTRARSLARTFWGAGVLVAAIWAGLILAAPVAESFGMTEVSAPLFNFFGYICHQLPDRSFHLGAHKFGVCSRCSGVYFGVLLGFLVYPLFRRVDDAEPLSRVWLILAMVPMGIDWSLTFFGIWENTFFSRVATGLVLGVACAVFLVPAFAELAEMFQRKSEQ
jgi:uncharacterized membrane protein